MRNLIQSLQKHNQQLKAEAQRNRRKVKETQSEINKVYMCTFFEPVHGILVLITLATSEGTGEHAHPPSLARVFTVRAHEVWK